MRMAMAILPAMATALSGCSAGPAEIDEAADPVYRQEVSDRFEGADPPPGAPRSVSLPPFDAELAGEWPKGVLPVGPIRGALAVRGEPWCATARGLLRLVRVGGPPSWRYYAGKRWLPDDLVTGLAPDGTGGIWARTQTGWARLRFIAMTLEEKAAVFEERVRARHLRHGLVASSYLERPGDLSTSRTATSDNDGLWTAIYVAAESFRYAVTGDEAARRSARESYRALERLQTISGIRGFPARSFVPAGEPTGGGEWHPTADGAWLWKGDTSSDEVDGHFFAAGIYFDLAADDLERASIRKNIGALMDHIIEHGYYLADVDGKPTTWGVWAPEKLNGNPAWRADRGLNSVEVLSYLATAEHVTGDARYRRAARELIEKHGYAENTLGARVSEPRGEVNHSDDELLFLSYRNLLAYEEDSRLLAVYRMSLARSFSAVAPEENPLYAVIAAAGGSEEAAESLEEAMETLRATPIDLVAWRMENSHRKDLLLAPHRSRAGELVSLLPLHPAERGGLKYNSDPYVLDAGGDGREEDDGSFFLLAYWMARYEECLAPPKA